MLKQIVLPILGVVAFLAIVGIFVQKSGKLSFNFGSGSQVSTESQKVVKIDGKDISVEIANTEDLRSKGLSGRSTVDWDTGMLFVFDRKDVSPVFWMKDMITPIDIIWINDDKIVKIDKDVPAPKEGTPESGLQLYTPGGLIDYVLEVHAGYSDTNNFKVGDSVTIPSL